MESRNTRQRQSSRQVPAGYQSVTEEEMLSEGEYDDTVWETRPSSSARRYQGLVDVHSESGRVADVQALPSNTVRRNGRTEQTRSAIPARRTATQVNMPALPAPRLVRNTIDEDYERKTTIDYQTAQPRSRRRFHWLVYLGLAMLVMILGWSLLSAVGSWWQTTQDDWHYGRPRTFQIDQVVGHNDSPQHPSHFIVENLNRHILIIEIPGGDPSKSIIFSGPTLVGPDQDLTPVTLSFQDVNHDGKLDMLVNIQGSQLVFLNKDGTFVPTNQNQGSGS